ncbi:alpha/beta hydrolase [Dyadobacter pollutisoli]|uniref:Alpha/beta hydrolase n=1 Tax=Dyadobacter pollutisoli TaxID=2910158 RepID=A0A9E8NAY6_9BACT|nr:alpha/beta hydrolase [Dyadobacter pollutisoli]WAC11201.1 alpha/beta hydrolase [Dyadobacter pollutisoli]
MNNSFVKPLPYHKLGYGPNILLAFHGIGQDGVSCFKSFETQLGQHYTIYAFDLFFHGRSRDFSFQVITKELWTELIRDFLRVHNITRFDIAGFSMGGRFALAVLEAFPSHIKNAFLIAPDGISEHPAYTLASRFAPTRFLFKWFMQHPETFFRSVNMLRKAGILNDSLVRFTGQVLNTQEKRETIYNSWVAFRQLSFDIPQVYAKAKENHVRIILFTGKFDKLLKEADVRELANILPPEDYIVLKSGHSQLVAQAGVWICTLFK